MAAAGWYNALVIVVIYWAATFLTLLGGNFAKSVTTWAFLLFSLGALAVATVVPAKDISLTAGMMQAFHDFLARFDLTFLTPLIGLLLAAGAIGGVMAWIGGPSRGLLATAQEGELPAVMVRTNRHGVQITILLIQGAMVTGLAVLYVLMDDVSVAFFLLTTMTVSVYLAMYILMYAAAIKLRHSAPDLPRTYRVPGGKPGMWLVAGGGLLAVVFGLVLAFFPPSNLTIGNPTLYVALVAGGLILCVGSALVIHAFKKPAWREAEQDDVLA